MQNQSRYLLKAILQDAIKSNKLAFISGPRQVGKTTLAQQILSEYQHSGEYYNWDDSDFRKIWVRDLKSLVVSNKKNSLLIFDEVHKDRAWKSKIKGIYDLFKGDYKFIVTGSARLDFYRKSGDSLQGRYFPYRLHPLTAGESDFVKAPPEQEWLENQKTRYDWNELLQLSGFPEPFFGQQQNKQKRWQRLYRERLVFEDLRDLIEVKNVRLIETMTLLLTEKVGSPLSYQSLREDLSVSFETVKRWQEVLESLYYCYSIKPFSKNIKNAIKKEPKIYMYDWSLVENPGARFENLIASHLLKSCHAWTDCAYGEFDLTYVRDKQKREVDFLVTKDKKPFALIEVKSGATQPTASLLYYQKVLNPVFTIQVVKNGSLKDRRSLQYPGVQILGVEEFLSALN